MRGRGVKYSRRKFIASCILFTAGSVISATPISLPIKLLYNEIGTDIEVLLAQALAARKNGNFELAQELYKEVIFLNPNDLRAYFGLRKTYLIQKNKEYDVVRLFEQAFDSNPENIRIISQLAKEYTSIALGNNQVERMLNYEIPLLEKAYNLYELALSIEPDFPSLFGRGDGEDENNDGIIAEVGIKKVKNKIAFRADFIDARGNQLIKEEKKRHIRQFKNRFENLSETELEEKLAHLLSKPNPKDRGKHIKEIYRKIIKRKRKLKNYEEACLNAYQLHLFDQKDTLSLGIYKKLAKKTGQFSQLVTVAENNDLLQNTFWSKLGYFDALLGLYKSSQPSEVLYLMNDVVNQLNGNFHLTPMMKKELKFRKFEISILNQDLSEAKNNLIDTVDFLFGVNSPHDAIRLCKSLSNYFILIGQKALVIRFINLLLNPENPITDQAILQDELNHSVTQLFSRVRVEKIIHFEQLYKLREKLN